MQSKISNLFLQTIKNTTTEERAWISYIRKQLEEYDEYSPIAVYIENSYLYTITVLTLILMNFKQIYLINSKQIDSTEAKRLIITEIDPVCTITDKYDDIIDVETNYHHVIISIKPDTELEYGNSNHTLEIKTEFDFTLFLYHTPFEKYSKISSYEFFTLYDHLRDSLMKNGNILTNSIIHGTGSIKLYGSAQDYLLFWLVLRYTRAFYTQEFSLRELVNNAEHDNKKYGMEQILFVPASEIKMIWDTIIEDVLSNYYLFRLYCSNFWCFIPNFIIRHKLIKWFEPFKKVVIMGILDNIVLTKFLKNITKKIFYNTFGTPSCLNFMAMGNSIGQIDVTGKRGTYYSNMRLSFDPITVLGKVVTYDICLSHRNANYYSRIPIQNHYFEDNEEHATYLGRNVIGKSIGTIVVPDKIESIFSAFPFIKDSIMIDWLDKNILLINVNKNLLDANHVTLSQFNKIMDYQINNINSSFIRKEERINSYAIISESELFSFLKDDNGYIKKELLEIILKYARNLYVRNLENPKQKR